MPTRTSRKRRHIWDIPKKDLAELQRVRLPWWGVLGVIVGTFAMRPLFLRMGQLQLEIPVLMTVGVFGFAIYC